MGAVYCDDMPRHEPLGRAAPGEVIGETKVKLRRDKDGKLVGIQPDEAAEGDHRGQAGPARPAGRSRSRPRYAT